MASSERPHQGSDSSSKPLRPSKLDGLLGQVDEAEDTRSATGLTQSSGRRNVQSESPHGPEFSASSCRVRREEKRVTHTADCVRWDTEERGERTACSLGEKAAQLIGSKISFVKRKEVPALP